ncbi:sugar phosphate isomerase/epimerase [Sphingomonas naphthae]|uniref:Sugar phosphate isomerase/epimerase n=1 Tax=Sphingomonas naphthae TaxID=1813468 RepID=A0ABY7TNU8_9SPHN|nr:sugar phosphate isomerase/epimerase [Sphingomonas naphthae]WCT74913.1 sugar phosphate isomerase/epimerase [Sphingomonas naphthae]
MDRLGIDFISVFGMPPVAFVELAADLGVARIGLGPRPLVVNPGVYPDWSLVDDAALRREVKAALAANAVSIAIAEACLLFPGGDVRDTAPALDVLAELGAPCANIASLDPDRQRTFDQCALYAEMAEARGMRSTVEFAPMLGVPDLATARALVRHVDRPGFAILVDMLHLARSGGTTADLLALDPGEVGHIQLCDGLLEWTMDSYMHEAAAERLCPGTGQFPLAEWLAALPGTVSIGLEMPMQARALAGDAPGDWLGPCVTAARALMAEADGLRR